MKKTIFYGFFLVVAFFGYVRLADDVSIKNFYLIKWPEVSQLPLTPEVQNQAQQILRQPFHYMGKGRQFYVYESQDSQWVLKFIKCQRVNEWYEKSALFAWIKQLRQQRNREKFEKTADLFRSMQLAAGPLSDLSGVLCTHLQQKPEFKTEVTITDSLGITHLIAIDDVPFILQKKAQRVFPVLDELYIRGDDEGLERRANQLITLFETLACRGCIDIDDGAIARNNIGFLSDRAVFIDIGTFRTASDVKERFKQDISRLNPVYQWLKKKDPTLAYAFNQKLASAISVVCQGQTEDLVKQ